MKLVITPTVYVAIGIPASGKSYWWNYSVSNKLLPIKSCRRINADVIRSDLYGDINKDGSEEIVNKIIYTNLKSFLLHKIPIVYIDDNNLERNKRMKITSICKKMGYKSVALIFDTPLEICNTRISKTSKKLSLDNLKDQFKIIKESPVDYDEGWDDIIVIK
jgi:predicted kinase